jgi:hypothetical protein
MKRLRSRAPLASLSGAENLAALQSAPFPPALFAWMADALLLKTTPIGHILPREDLLPLESLRTFCLDARWLLAFASGAFSVGRSLSAELKLDEGSFPAIFTQSAAMAGLSAQGSQGPVADVVSGFLLRSDVVLGWPKIEARARDAGGNNLPRARWERVADGVMLALFVGQMAAFDLLEPAESLHFGLEQDPAYLGKKLLRFVTAPDAQAKPGEQIPVSLAPAVTPATRPHNVLRVKDLAAALEKELSAAKANQQADGSDRPFTSAEFALQMIEGVQAVTFSLAPPKPAAEGALPAAVGEPS